MHVEQWNNLKNDKLCFLYLREANFNYSGCMYFEMQTNLLSFHLGYTPTQDFTCCHYRSVIVWVVFYCYPAR